MRIYGSPAAAMLAAAAALVLAACGSSASRHAPVKAHASVPTASGQQKQKPARTAPGPAQIMNAMLAHYHAALSAGLDAAAWRTFTIQMNKLAAADTGNVTGGQGGDLSLLATDAQYYAADIASHNLGYGQGKDDLSAIRRDVLSAVSDFDVACGGTCPIRKHHHHHRTPSPAPAPSSAPAAPAVPALGCKILRDSSTGAEQFDVTTVGGGTYSGIIYVSFYDYAGSGDVFTGTTVDGASPLANWQPVPAADIGGSAEPTGCTASAG